MLCSPPKCRAFIAICCYMLHNTNTSGLPYGMSNVTNPAFIQAAQFLYAQYPGIYKMRIKHKGRTRRSVMIRVYSGTGLQRTKACKAVHQEGPRPARPPDPSGAVRQLIRSVRNE